MTTTTTTMSKKYIDELTTEVKSMLKADIYTDEQIEEACKEVVRGMSDMELFDLANTQEQLCDRCAGCCKFPSKVDVTTAELLNIAKRLDMSPAKTMKKFRMLSSGRPGVYHLQAKPCPFLKEPNICTIYDIRPETCRGFPAMEMISDAMEEKPLAFFEYCHIIKKFNSYRATMWLMNHYVATGAAAGVEAGGVVHEIQQARERLHSYFEGDPVIKELNEQLEKLEGLLEGEEEGREEEKRKRIRAQAMMLKYQISRRISELAAGY